MTSFRGRGFGEQGSDAENSRDLGRLLNSVLSVKGAEVAGFFAVFECSGVVVGTICGGSQAGAAADDNGNAA